MLGTDSLLVARLMDDLSLRNDMGEKRITYSEYLRLAELLELQDGGVAGGRDISADELHFIIVHQSFELWFKLILNQLSEARSLLSLEPVPESHIPMIVHHLDRTTEIMTLMQNQWKVMETLTPQGFLAFRDELGTASGFESFQMREMEIVLGLDNVQRPGGMDPLAHFEKLANESEQGKEAWNRLVAASNEESLAQVLTRWLARTPIHGSSPDDEGDEEVVRGFVEGHLSSMQSNNDEAIERHLAMGTQGIEKVKERFSASLAAAREYLLPEGQNCRHRAGLLFIESYRELPLLAWPRTLIDSVVELEQQLLLFRHHHVRMVERMIGRRVGTGGSSGVDYLDSTTKARIFTDLWQVRSILVKRDSLKDVSDSDFYGFTSG